MHLNDVQGKVGNALGLIVIFWSYLRYTEYCLPWKWLETYIIFLISTVFDLRQLVFPFYDCAIYYMSGKAINKMSFKGYQDINFTNQILRMITALTQFQISNIKEKILVSHIIHLLILWQINCLPSTFGRGQEFFLEIN